VSWGERMRDRLFGRRGNAATLGLSFITLLAASALVVDIGFGYASQTELQATLDAAALAGVGYFDKSDAGIALARVRAVEFAAKNSIMGEPLVLPDDAISVGTFDVNGNFVATNDPDVVDAMTIDHTKVDVPVFFSAVAFGTASMSANARSGAIQNPPRPAGRTNCFLPLAVPDCVLDGNANYEDLELKLNSANEDNAGWADLMGPPNAAGIRDAIGDQCQAGTAAVGEEVYLNNGTVTAALSELADVLSGNSGGSTGAWNDTTFGPIPAQMSGSTVEPAEYGQHVVEGPIVLFDGGGGDCLANTQFNRSKTITGFSWASIYDVDSQGRGKNIRVRLDLTTDYQFGSGGGGSDGQNLTAPGTGTLVY